MVSQELIHSRTTDQPRNSRSFAMQVKCCRRRRILLRTLHKIEANFDTLGYRHQFGFFTLNLAKSLSSRDLGVSRLRSISLIFHRLTVFSENSKSVEGNFVGVQLPLPAPPKLFIFTNIRIAGLIFVKSFGTNTVQCVSCLFSII